MQHKIKFSRLSVQANAQHEFSFANEPAKLETSFINVGTWFSPKNYPPLLQEKIVRTNRLAASDESTTPRGRKRRRPSHEKRLPSLTKQNVLSSLYFLPYNSSPSLYLSTCSVNRFLLFFLSPRFHFIFPPIFSHFPPFSAPPLIIILLI